MIIALISISPTFMEASAVSNINSPFNPSVSPQFISDSFKVNLFIRNDFNLFRRYAISLEYKGFGLGWQSIDLNEEFANQVYLGMNFYMISANISYTLEGDMWMGVGFYREFMNFSICGYSSLFGRKFSYACLYIPYERGYAGLDIFMEEGYPVEYKTFVRFKLNDDFSIDVSYTSGSRMIFTSLNYRWISIGYCEHDILGSCMYSNVSYSF